MFTLSYRSYGGEMFVLGLNAEQTKKYSELSEDELVGLSRSGPEYVDHEVIIIHVNGAEPSTGELDGNELDEAIIEEKNDEQVVELIDSSEYIDKLKSCKSIFVYKENAEVTCDMEIDEEEFDPDKLTHISSSFEGEEFPRINEIAYGDERIELDWVIKSADCEIQILNFTIEDTAIELGDSIREIDYCDE